MCTLHHMCCEPTQPPSLQFFFYYVIIMLTKSAQTDMQSIAKVRQMASSAMMKLTDRLTR